MPVDFYIDRMMLMTPTRWVTTLAFLAVAPCEAQNAMPQTDTSSPPPAAAADVRSMDAIVHAYYDVISGPAATPRDWNRFYSLFAPGGRLIQTTRAADGPSHVRVMTPQAFVERNKGYLDKNPFYEHEISHSSADTFGAITQIFSTYEVKDAPTDAKPSARGIYSAQLFNDGKRWYVVTMYWDNEHPGSPIPARYLK